MSRVLVLVEGQTEETFIKDCLSPQLTKTGVFLIPTLVKTKVVKGASHFKGGVQSYGRIKRDVERLLNDTDAVKVTTMFDLYGLPEDFPGKQSASQRSSFERVEYLEKAFYSDVGNHRLLPYLSLHEFEALLFVDVEQIVRQFTGSPHQQKRLEEARKQFDSPEEINEGLLTAPSKRITSVFPEYRGPLHGSLISKKIGLERIRAECPHFHQWLQKLEALSGEET